MRHRIFLLSPAQCGGERAQLLLHVRAKFELAARLRSASGAPLGEVFSFLSGLYFRAKLLYAGSFMAPPCGIPGVLVITPNSGLHDPGEPLTLETLRQYAAVPIDVRQPRYRRPLVRDARILARAIEITAPQSCDVVLLGSIATGKYVDLLVNIFREGLLFPIDFVGRGDMSRGGLLLRCVDQQRELPYVPVQGAVRHGRRPPKLQKRVNG